jgi:solute carrier family 25 carnitine/acylcarnitine transporter 20/29
VKSRIQSSSALGKPMGVYGVTRELIIREGIAGLYRGITPALIRAVPANAAFFTGQENSKRWLDTLF